MRECTPGFFGRPHPHRFEARFEYSRQEAPEYFWTVITVLEGDLPRIAAPKYIGDICVRCGEWRAAPPPP